MEVGEYVMIFEPRTSIMSTLQSAATTWRLRERVVMKQHFNLGSSSLKS
jgi:hypothetical protein